MPYQSKGDMRQLSRSDREKSHNMIRDGGNKVSEACYKFASWEVTLLKSPADFFHSSSDPTPPLDGNSPILLLLSRH